MIGAERILGKFSREIRERPSRRVKSSLVPKTEGCPEGPLVGVV